MPPSHLVVDFPPLVRFTATSVLRVAGVILFFVCWLVVIYHAGLILHAEWKLARMLEVANEFATLPQVNPEELERVVRDELARAGWNQGKVTLMRLPAASGPSEFRVAKLEVPSTQVLPRWSSPLGFSMMRPLRAQWRDLPSPPEGPSWWGLD